MTPNFVLDVAIAAAAQLLFLVTKHPTSYCCTLHQRLIRGGGGDDLPKVAIANAKRGNKKRRKSFDFLVKYAATHHGMIFFFTFEVPFWWNAHTSTNVLPVFFATQLFRKKVHNVDYVSVRRHEFITETGQWTCHWCSRTRQGGGGWCRQDE